MIFEVKNGSFAYPKRETIFSGVNFSLSSGNLLAVIGANGAGKTTLLRCITGMLRWKEGESLIDGKNIASISQRELWNRISYVPQNKDKPVSYTVTQTVLLGLSGKIGVFSSPKKEDYLKAEETLEKLGIAHLADKKCNEISGGEMQMVLIARALISEPEMLILDEPETNLDFKNQYIVLDTVKSLVDGGIACIFNTHYPEHALGYADKALILMKNESLFGESKDVISEENIRSAFGVDTCIKDIVTGSGDIRKVIVRG